MEHVYSPICVQIKLRTTELCTILKITKVIFCHAYRVICLTKSLENWSVHEVTIVVQTFCGLKVLRVLAKEI